MNNGRKAFVKTDGRSSDLTASSADGSGKDWRKKAKTLL